MLAKEPTLAERASSPAWSDPLWSRVRLPIERHARALGLELRLRTNEPEIAALFESAFGLPVDQGHAESGLGSRSGSGSGSGRPEPDLLIEAAAALDEGGRWRAAEGAGNGAGNRAPGSVEEDASAKTASHHAPGRSFHRERAPLYTAGDDRGSVVCADLAGGRAAAFVAHGCRRDIARLVLLESPVWRMATWRGMVALHAAALRLDGVGVVLRGAPGAGKSTLAAAAIDAGLGVLADEVTWFDPSGSPAVLRGLGRWVHVEPELAAVAPALLRERRLAAGAPRGKVALSVPSAQSVLRATPGPLVLLEDAGTEAARPSKASWQAMTSEAAEARFDALCIRGEGSQSPAAFTAARNALTVAGGYALRAGPPGQALEALEQIVAHWRVAQPATTSGARR